MFFMRCCLLRTVAALWIVAFCFATVSALALPAGAQTINWINAAGGSYNTSTNWNPANVPNNVTETARFNLAATFNVTFQSGTNTLVNDLFVDNGDVTFAANGSVFATYTTNDDAFVAGGDLTLSDAGGAGDLNLNVLDDLVVRVGSMFSVLQGADVTAHDLILGTSGDGTMVVDGAGSTLAVAARADLGQVGGTGTLTFQNGSTGNSIGGTLQLMAFSGFVNSTGRLNVLSGSALQMAGIFVGNSGSSTAVQEATLRVDGASSVLAMTGASPLTIGDDINPNIIADVIVSGGGQFDTGTGNIFIRNSGRLDIQNSSTFNANGNITVDGGTLSRGSSTSSVLNLANGHSLTARNNAQINFFSDYTIDNDTIWTIQDGADYNTDSFFDDIDVGVITDGTLTVQNFGSSLTLGAGAISQIATSGATGTVTIRDRATATFGNIDIADTSSTGTIGTLTIEDGAQVTAGFIDLGTFNTFSATTVTAELTIGSPNTFIDAVLTLTGSSSLDVGAFTPSATSTATVNINDDGQLISGTGGIIIRESGLVNIDGGLLQANGNVSVSEGELLLTSDFSGVFDLEPGLTLTASSGGQVNFNRSYDIDEDTTFLIQSGANFTVNSFLDIGDGLGESGTLTVDGSGSTATVASTTSVGRFGGTGSLTLRNDASASFNSVTVMQSSGGNPTSGTVLVDSGATVTSGSLFVNTSGGDGTSGIVTITGAGSSWAASSLILGDELSGTAELKVLDGGSFSTSSAATFQETGVMTIDGGTVDLGFHSASGGRIDLVSGSLSTGSTLAIEGGGLLGNILDLTPGRNLATTLFGGDINLEATGVLLVNGGTLSVDTINDNGGTFQFNSGTLTLRGFDAFNINPLSVFGNAFTLGAGQHVVLTGDANVAASSMLTVSGGTLTSSTEFDNAGTVVVGAGSLVEVDQFDNLGTGALVLGPSAIVHTTGAGSKTNQGEILLQGGLATFDFDGTTFTNIGLVRGEGTFDGNLANSSSGELRASPGERLLVTGANGTNSGKLNLQGGTLEFDQALTNGAGGNILGRGTLVVGGAGLTNIGDIALSNGQTDVFGDVDNQGTGRVIISGNADVTFWDDVTDSGALFNVSAGSSATLFGTAGFGISGGGDVFFEADVTPGSSPGLETFGGNVHFGTLANLEIEIAGTTPGTEHDRLDIAGGASLDGTLDLVVLDSLSTFGDATLTILNAFALSGTFADVPEVNDGAGAGHLGRGIFFEGINYNPTSVTIDLLQALAGDTNGDRQIDNADILGILSANSFNNGSGFDWTQGDFNGDTFVDNADILAILATGKFGAGPYAALANNFGPTVPEPSSLVLAMLALAALFARQLRPRSM